jgi:mono/diheme cytochrome c family protein
VRDHWIATSLVLAAVSSWVQGCGGTSAESGSPAVEPATPHAAPAAVAPPADSAAGPDLASQAATSPRDTAGEAGRDKLLVTENEYQGWKYYAVYCERCHGPDALGTLDAPDLRYSVSEEGAVSADSFRVVVLKGAENREENKVMKGFEGLLDDERIDQLYAYVKARSEERLAAGRPHRATGP